MTGHYKTFLTLTSTFNIVLIKARSFYWRVYGQITITLTASKLVLLASKQLASSNNAYSKNALLFVSPIRSNPSIQPTPSIWNLQLTTYQSQNVNISSQTKADKTPLNTAKYLGIYINGKLSWNHHVDTISKKANVKQYCYETYVRPQLEYASTVWSPYTKANIDKLEMVQWNAAGYVFQDFKRYSSPNAMIKQL